MRIYKLILIICDILMINLSFFATLLLRFDGVIPNIYLNFYANSALVLTTVSILIFALGRLYRSLWIYASIHELFQVIVCSIFSLIAFYAYTILYHYTFPTSIYLIYGLLSIVSVVGSRICYRVARRFKQPLRFLFSVNPYNLQHSRMFLDSRILLVGAGEATSLIIKDFQEHYISSSIILAVDDSPYKQHTSINNIPIRGTISDIPTLVQKYAITKIIIAIPSAPKARISEIVALCNTTSCKLEIFPGIQNSFHASSIQQHIRPVSIEDLLGREEVLLDNTPLRTQLENQTVLVTGGGGSIGSELCRQVASYNVAKLIIFDIYENNAYDIQNELLAKGFPPNRLGVIIGSVRDTIKLHRVFDQFHPDIVFHAAAHKHVPLMEANPSEAIKNNVYGTLNTALCAKEYFAKKFILISTDKAVNPTNIMGASKRLCEMIIQGLANTSSKTSFAAVRFGNVLGSNGSVIPLFKKQLEAGGPLTVTHEDIIRYFMTIPEAVRLILQATLFANGGEIFVLDMGEPVKILDLAKNFIKLSGLTLGKDIDIQITGLRPGEKLYEELLLAEEGLKKTACNKIFIGQPSMIDFDLLQHSLYHLKDYFHDERQLKEAIMKLVPTYHPISYEESILVDTKKLSAI